MFKIVVEDMVSVLITAHKSGLLSNLVMDKEKVESATQEIYSPDGKVDISKLSEKDAQIFKEKAQHGERLFSEEGMSEFLDFIEKEVGSVYVKIWEDIDFLGHSIEAILAFQKTTPEEMLKMIKANKDFIDKRKKKSENVPEIVSIDEEVKN